MTLSADIAAAIAAEAKEVDMNVAETKGGYTPPPAGNAIVTLVGYVEIGIQHVEASKTEPLKYPAHDEDQACLVFELSGKNYPVVEKDGKFFPMRMEVKLKISRNEKAWYYKIFKALNYAGDATTFAQLVGRHFLATVVHSAPNAKGAVYASFKNKDTGYTFRAPLYQPNALEEPDTYLPFPKPRVYSEQRIFLWRYASKSMWDSLYIAGQYEERKDEKTGKVISPAKSKNVFQDQIRGAKNFAGSPAAAFVANEPDLELPLEDAAALGAQPTADQVDAALDALSV